MGRRRSRSHDFLAEFLSERPPELRDAIDFLQDRHQLSAVWRGLRKLAAQGIDELVHVGELVVVDEVDDACRGCVAGIRRCGAGGIWLGVSCGGGA